MLLQQGDAVDILHHDVGEHQVEVVELESFEGLAPTAGQFDVVSLALECGSDHGAHRGFVIDDKNPRGLAGCLASAECGRGVRRLRNCELRSQTPALILFAHLLPLIRVVKPHRFCPAAIHCPCTSLLPNKRLAVIVITCRRSARSLLCLRAATLLVFPGMLSRKLDADTDAQPARGC